MAPIRLSKRTIDAIKPTGSEFFVWDDELAGFGIRVRASGAMTYVAQYRLPGGRGAPTRRLTLAAVGKLTPDEARKLAKSKLAEVAKGGDPAQEKAERRYGLTVNDLADAFLSRHVESKRKGSTAEFYRGVLETHVRPVLGGRRAEDLSRQDVAKLHQDLKIKRSIPIAGSDRQRVVGGTYVANRVLAVIGAMYSWAGKAGLVKEGLNPATRVEKYREEGRERYLTPAEIERLGAVLREAETVGLPYETDDSKPASKHAAKFENRRTVYTEQVTGAIRLLMFSGMRLREVLNLRWEDVDLSRGVLFLPTSKTGKKTVVLSAPAVAVIAEMPQVGRYVFAGESAGAIDETPRRDLKRPWARIIERADLGELRLHDLRHTFASLGAGAGISLPLIGRLLGHTQAATTERYAHLADDPLRRAADRIGAELARVMGDSRKEGGEVIEISKARKPA